MTKKKKRYKKKPHSPPLSKLDKTIYVIGYVFIFILPIISLFLYHYAINKIAYSDPLVISFCEKGMLWILPLFMYLPLSAVIFWYDLQTSNQPIFGNPNVIYGIAPWTHIYPVFSKKYRDRRRHLHPSTIKNQRKWLLFWVAGLILCLFLSFFSLFGRITLQNNGDVIVYDVWNNEKQTYTVEDVLAFEIHAGRHSTGKGTSIWKASIIFRMNDGKNYQFDPAVEEMIQLKALVESDKIIISGTENLNEVIDDHKYSQEQIALLYELFELFSE